MRHSGWRPPSAEWSETIRAFLDNPPPGTPEAVFEALGAQEEGLPPRLFHEVVEQSAVAISITDPQARILYANPAFERVTGYGREEIVGHNESLLSDKQTPQRVYAEMWDCLLRQESWSGVLINRSREGRRYLADLTIAPVLGPDGGTTHFLGMHRDVTELHALEQQVRNQKAQLESLLNSAPVAMALIDQQQEVVLDNLTYKALAADLGGIEPATLLLEHLRRESEGEGPVSDFHNQEIRIESGAGTEPRWFVCSGTWFEERDANAEQYFDATTQRYMLLVADEVTTLKHREEETRQSAQRALLAEAERAQGMREALSGALFQLEGPFNLVSAAANLLDRRELAGEVGVEVRDILRQALEAGQEARRLLESAIPEVPTGEHHLVNLNELLRDLLRMVADRMLAQGIVVDWRPEPMPIRIYGQEGRLQLLLKQILDNALDALEYETGGDRELRIRTGMQGDSVQITVADTGPGISPEMRYKVFQPFFTTKGRGSQRMGMGLALAQEVINEHAGTIEVDTGHAEGACFRIQLPSAQRAALSG